MLNLDNKDGVYAIHRMGILLTKETDTSVLEGGLHMNDIQKQLGTLIKSANPSAQFFEDQMEIRAKSTLDNLYSSKISKNDTQKS